MNNLFSIRPTEGMKSLLENFVGLDIDKANEQIVSSLEKAGITAAGTALIVYNNGSANDLALVLEFCQEHSVGINLVSYNKFKYNTVSMFFEFDV